MDTQITAEKPQHLNSWQAPDRSGRLGPGYNGEGMLLSPLAPLC